MKCCKCHKEDSVGHGVHFWYFKSEVVLCEDCYEKYGVERMVFEHKFLTGALDNEMTAQRPKGKTHLCFRNFRTLYQRSGCL